MASEGTETSEEFLARLQRERQELTEAGEYCSRCGKWTGAFRPPGCRQKCRECRAIDTNDGEVSSSQYLRCPKCGHSWDAFDCEEYEVFSDGEHRVSCGDCDHEFEVSTRVSYTFYSPAREAPDAE